MIFTVIYCKEKTFCEKNMQFVFLLIDINNNICTNIDKINKNRENLLSFTKIMCYNSK